MTDSKYGHLIHDGAFEVDEDDDDLEDDPRVTVDTHSIVIDERVDDEYIAKYRWRFSIDHDNGARTVRGWTRTDIEQNGTEDYASELTWSEMPADVKMRLAVALGVPRSELEGILDLPEHLLAGDGK